MLVHGDNQDFFADVVYIFLELVIAILAVLGNTLVCWAVYVNSNLQNVTNYFVVSLAAADVAVGVLAIPFAITISTGFCAGFYGCLFIACFVLVLTQSSIFSLLAIAIDRFIAIRMPLRYNALVTASRAKGIIAICWLLSFIIGLTPMLGWHQTTHGQNSSFLHNCSEKMVACLFEAVVTMEYMVYYNFFACVLTPLLLMFGIYLKIFMAARRQLKQIENKMMMTVVPGERSRSTLQKEVHAAKSLAIIVGLFALCWLPLHIMNCYTLFCPACLRSPLWLMYLAIILSHANSVVNPLIYAYRIREFRLTFRKIIHRHFLGRKERFKPASASQRTSLHGGETENSTVRLGEGDFHFFAGGDWNGLPMEGNLGKIEVGLELRQKRHGLEGDVNGHLTNSCQNGDLSSASKKLELLSQELKRFHASCLVDLEVSVLDGVSNVS